MNLRELRTAIDTIDDDYDQYDVRIIPTSTSVMLVVAPDMTGRKIRDADLVDGVLLIQNTRDE